MLRRLLEPGQYTSQQFAALADELGVRLSASRTGQCWDNALAESFFATINRELLETAAWPSPPRAEHPGKGPGRRPASAAPPKAGAPEHLTDHRLRRCSSRSVTTWS
ncbi:integrase core domain-containing protein [Streptomyces sp. V1I1]|uniref:integrase core domain-containing protein n=1 Tax=Streptomyces sp. V1I1 TaxID=3042272 RepID=UPI00358DF076